MEHAKKCTGPPHYSCLRLGKTSKWSILNSGSLLISLAVAACTFMVVFGLIYLYKMLKSYSRGPITTSPITPDWLTNPRLLSWNSRVKVYTSRFVGVKQRVESYSTKRVKKMLTDYQISSKLNLNLFNSNFELPDNVSLVVQVPKKNFKCSESLLLNEFVPLSGHYEQYHYSYQFFGDGAIQATYYNVGPLRYVAGFTIYIPSPYHWGVRYPKWLFRRLSELPDYYPSDPDDAVSLCWCIIDLQPVVITENCIGEVSRHEISGEKSFRRLNWCRETFMPDYPISPRLTSRKLRARMCQKLRQPVTIGYQNGKVCHVEWIDGKFKVTGCSSCGEMEEGPPKYESLTVRKKD